MIVRHSKFDSNPFGDGGSKRSAQIEELLKNNGIEYINEPLDLPKGLSIIDYGKLSLRAICFISKNVGWKHYHGLKSKIDAVKYFALRLPILFDKYQGQDITFIWESTISPNYVFPYLLKAAGSKVIAFPHNLESLVPTQTDHQTKKPAPYWLQEEIERLKLCDKVYTISKEECWLLRQYGVDALYLPYYPPRDAEQFFLSIRRHREKRQENKKKKYLLLGSATNPPTRNGMQKLVDEAVSRFLSYDIYIAGYQTESLIVRSNDNLHFLGALTNDELCYWLETVDAILIYQPPTSGALTRIAEMLIAGIPVFANFDAARNYHNTTDVNVYQSFDDLFSNLSSFIPHQAAMIQYNHSSFDL